MVTEVAIKAKRAMDGRLGECEARRRERQYVDVRYVLNTPPGWRICANILSAASLASGPVIKPVIATLTIQSSIKGPHLTRHGLRIQE